MEDRALNDLDNEIAEMEKAFSGTPKEESTEPEKESPRAQDNPKEPTVDPVIVPEVSKLQEDLSIAQKRYNNYKGSTDITIRDLRNELHDLRSQVSNLQSENAQLKISTEPSKDVSSYFSDEDREILGETAVEALDRSVKEIVDSKVTPLKEQLEKERKEKEEARKRQAEVRMQETQSLFVTKLKSIVPDYENILGNKEFFTWIEDIDPYSGYTRKNLFTRAESDGDVGRVASFFNEFKALSKSKESALEEHVVPSGVTGNVPVGEEKPEFQINEKFIDKFYNDLSRGDLKYKGKKGRELAERTEAAIDKWVTNQFR